MIQKDTGGQTAKHYPQICAICPEFHKGMFAHPNSQLPSSQQVTERLSSVHMDTCPPVTE